MRNHLIAIILQTLFWLMSYPVLPSLLKKERQSREGILRLRCPRSFKCQWDNLVYLISREKFMDGVCVSHQNSQSGAVQVYDNPESIQSRIWFKSECYLFKVKSTGLKVVKKAFKFGLSFYFLNDLVSKCGFLLIPFPLPLCDKHFWR